MGEIELKRPTIWMFAHWAAIIVFCVVPLCGLLDHNPGRVAIVIFGTFAALGLVEYLHGLWDEFLDVLQLSSPTHSNGEER